MHNLIAKFKTEIKVPQRGNYAVLWKSFHTGFHKLFQQNFSTNMWYMFHIIIISLISKSKCKIIHTYYTIAIVEELTFLILIIYLFILENGHHSRRKEKKCARHYFFNILSGGLHICSHPRIMPLGDRMQSCECKILRWTSRQVKYSNCFGL